MAKQSMTALTEEILSEYLRGGPLEIWKVEFKKEGRDHMLRVYIDRPGGYVSTDDCEDVSRYLSEKLDELDPVSVNYYLVVSSPGMDRRLYTRTQYERYIGHEAEVKLFAAVDGRRKYEGTLAGIDDDVLTLTVDGKNLRIPFDKVAGTRLKVVF